MNTRLLAFAMVCASCAGNVDDPDGTGAGLGGITISTAPKLTVDGFEPQAPVEGRRTFVHFTLSNAGFTPARTGRVGAIITPVGSPAYEAPFSWRIDALARGGVASGVVAFDAPVASHANDLLLFFEDATTKAHVVEVHHAFDVARRFTFELPDVFADTVRSPHADTDWAALAAHNPNGPDPVPDTAFLGNLSSGQLRAAGLEGKGFVDAIPDVDSVLLGSIVVNASWTGTPQQLQSLQALATDVLIGQSFTFGPGAADCTGVVALAPQTVTARQLFDLTGGASGNGVGDATVGGIGQLPAYQWDNDDYPYPRCYASHYRVVVAFESRTRRFDPDIVVLPPVASLNTNGALQLTVENGTPVDWIVDAGAIDGQISQTGRFTLSPNVGPNTLVAVRATAADGSGRTGVAYVSLNPNRPTVVGGSFTFVH